MMKKDTGLDDLDIKEMLDLIHVPEINRALAEKMEEWKGDGFRSFLLEYQQQLERYFINLYEKPLKKMQTTGEDKKARLYWFELLQYQVGDWRMQRFHPWDGYYHY
jgi:hypothetical protein